MIFRILKSYKLNGTFSRQGSNWQYCVYYSEVVHGHGGQAVIINHNLADVVFTFDHVRQKINERHHEVLIAMDNWAKWMELRQEEVLNKENVREVLQINLTTPDKYPEAFALGRGEISDPRIPLDSTTNLPTQLPGRWLVCVLSENNNDTVPDWIEEATGAEHGHSFLIYLPLGVHGKPLKESVEIGE
jgi:hypothetical protein